MSEPVRYRVRWELDDEHHINCALTDCAKNFCRRHRRIYWECQDFDYERAVNYFGGDGECVKCKSEASLARYVRERNAYDRRLGLSKSA